MRKNTLILFILINTYISITAFAQKSHQNCMVIIEPFPLINKGFDIGLGYGIYKHKMEIKYRHTSDTDPIAQQSKDFKATYKNINLHTIILLKNIFKVFLLGVL